MTKFTALGLLLALFCCTQPSIAADADDSTPPASAVPTPQNDGTGAAGGWRRHHHMQADANGQAPAAGASSTGASQGQGPGPGGGRRRGQGLGLGGGGGQGPGRGHMAQRIKAAMGLQSLTADQRQKIKGIVDALHQDEQNLRGQIKALDGGAAPGAGSSAAPAKGSAPATASAGGDSQGQIKQLHQQMRQKGMAAWQQIKGVLSDAQMKELDQAEASNGQLVAPKGGSAPSSGKAKDDSEG